MEEMVKVYDKWMKWLTDGEYTKLREELNDQNPANIAEFFEELPAGKELFIFRLLTKDLAAEVFSYMDADLQENIVSSITDQELQGIVSELFIDDAVDFLGELPANLVTKVLRNTDETKRKLINQFLNYPDDSAGSIMTIEFVQFHEDTTVKRAMEQLRRTGVNKETIYTCYVINASRILIGIVPLRTLILSDDDVMVKDIMEDNVISVKTLDDQEEIADLFKKYNLISLPVVDNEGRLVGIITVDDIVDVIEAENTEDFEKMAALLPSEEQYLKTSVFSLAKNRIVWLLVLMVSGTVSSAIIGSYESVLASVVILSSFIPILMDTGGNAGSQASTLIIRGMALGEIEMSDILTVIWKEVRVGMISGAALGAVNFLRLMILSHGSFRVNITVSLSIMLIVVVAKTIGCVLPMAAKKLNFDPAIMAGPLITTVVDSVALVIFFQFAKIFVL